MLFIIHFYHKPVLFLSSPFVLRSLVFSVIHVYVLKHHRYMWIGIRVSRVLSSCYVLWRVRASEIVGKLRRLIDIDTNIDVICHICSLSAPNPCNNRAAMRVSTAVTRERDARSHLRRRRVARSDDKNRWRFWRSIGGRTAAIRVRAGDARYKTSS